MALDLTTAENGDITLRVPRQIAPKYTQELDTAYERLAHYSTILRTMWNEGDNAMRIKLFYLFRLNWVELEDLGIAYCDDSGNIISHQEAPATRPVITCGGCGMPVTNCCCG